PDQAGNGPYRASPVAYVPTIFDRLDQVGLSWRIYGKPDGTQSTKFGWSICPTFYECLGSDQLANLVPTKSVSSDASRGQLPAFSIVIPAQLDSQHPHASMARGDNWFGSVVQQIESGPDWGSTAIFITWDDCGCFYDHVNPWQYDRSWGVREPMIIVSPYAKPGYTDS